MSGAAAGPPFAPIAAPADSLPATLPMVLEQLWQRIAAGRCFVFHTDARSNKASATFWDDADAIGHFAVVRVCAVALDWLWLGPRDMRRALFRWDDAGATAT